MEQYIWLEMYQNYRINDLEQKLNILKIYPLDVMVTGVTGAGKSTTLNTFFQKELASVGTRVDPETKELSDYSLNKLFRLWDTPGLGDGIEKDKIHSKKIIDLLYEDYTVKKKQYGFIDLVLVILEAKKDMGTSYKLLNEIITPNFEKKRILVALNQADIAMKGRYWDYNTNKPLLKLKDTLENFATSIQERVYEATNIEIKRPIYYSAKYNYNIHALLDLLIDNVPKKRRKLANFG